MHLKEKTEWFVYLANPNTDNKGWKRLGVFPIRRKARNFVAALKLQNEYCGNKDKLKFSIRGLRVVSEIK